MALHLPTGSSKTGCVVDPIPTTPLADDLAIAHRGRCNHFILAMYIYISCSAIEYYVHIPLFSVFIKLSKTTTNQQTNTLYSISNMDMCCLFLIRFRVIYIYICPIRYIEYIMLNLNFVSGQSYCDGSNNYKYDGVLSLKSIMPCQWDCACNSSLLLIGKGSP